MPATKVLARDWTFSINTGTTTTPAWTPILGVNSFGVSRSKNDVDTTDFASAGWTEHLVASRGWEFTLEGFHLEDTDGTRDPGQTAVEANTLLMGAASLDQYKFTSPGGKVYTFVASAVVDGPGGGSDDATSWACTLTVSGTVTIT